MFTLAPGSDARASRDADALPVHEAPWTYCPGQREVLRAHEPAFQHFFRDVVLPSRSREYAHVLAGGAETAVAVSVLDFVDSGSELFVLVHATRRVAAPARLEEGRRPLTRFLDQPEAVLDAQQTAPAATASDELAFEPDWLRRGATRTAPDLSRAIGASAPAAVVAAERETWRALDALVALVKRSRSSGVYDLPPRVEALRPANAPQLGLDRAVRLSFSLDSVLGLDRAADRQRLLDSRSAAERLRGLTELADEQGIALAAALEGLG